MRWVLVLGVVLGVLVVAGYVIDWATRDLNDLSEAMDRACEPQMRERGVEECQKAGRRFTEAAIAWMDRLVWWRRVMVGWGIGVAFALCAVAVVRRFANRTAKAS